VERLIKSKNGQWSLIKVADEVKNRIAEKVSRMAEQGQGDVKANTSESIYNIPKEAKDFNPHIHLFHPNASDPLHRLNQDEWHSHFQNMMQNDKLNTDQIDTLEAENKRRDNVIHMANQKKSKKPVFDPRAIKRGESDVRFDNVDYKVRIERDFGDIDRMSPEDREKIKQQHNLSTENIMQRKEQQEKQQAKNKELADSHAAEVERVKHEKFKEAQKSIIKNLPLNDKKQMDDLYKRISGSKDLADKISRYLHIVHEVKPDGSVANISYHLKNHASEQLNDFVTSMRGDNAPYTENRFVGLDDVNPHDTPNLIDKKGA